uniref:Uncharacterized protein n=1 Tax=Cacopsylla melanoneura TaxID=428564 RepID=A0A8D8SIQ3_9HEMI
MMYPSEGHCQSTSSVDDMLQKLKLYQKYNYKVKLNKLRDIISYFHTVCQRPNMARFLIERDIGKLLLPLVQHRDPSIGPRVLDIYKQLCGLDEFQARFTREERLALIRNMRRMHSLAQIDSGVVWSIVQAFDRNNPRPMKPLIEYQRREARARENIVEKIYEVRNWI